MNTTKPTMKDLVAEHNALAEDWNKRNPTEKVTLVVSFESVESGQKQIKNFKGYHSLKINPDTGKAEESMEAA